MKTSIISVHNAFINSIHQNQLSITSFEQHIYFVCRLRSINDVIMLYNTLL